MKKLFGSILFLCYFSCIPLRIAPSIETDKVMVAKKFKRKLPKQHAFIFEDPKDANEFYNYVNTKYELLHQDVEFNVPFEIEAKPFYFSFHEVEILDKQLNLLPIVVDTALDNNNINPIFENEHVTRQGNWYLAITVLDDDMNDGLKSDYIYREKIVKYLKNLRIEYLNTQNYLEALFIK